MRFTASWVEVQRCGQPTLSGRTCPFEGEVQVNQTDDGPTWWGCPSCWRDHYGDAERIEDDATPWTEPRPEVVAAIEALVANGYACPSCGYRPVGTARHQVAQMEHHRSEERRRVIAQANTGSGRPA